MSPSDDPVAHFFGGRNDVPAPSRPPAPSGVDELNVESVEDAADGLEGEIAVDVYETDTDVIIISPIAGVDPDEISISAGEDTVTISGQRKAEHTAHKKNLITQEIYWGTFERTVELPIPCEITNATASCKQGVLTVTIPKSHRARKKTIKVKSEE